MSKILEAEREGQPPRWLPPRVQLGETGPAVPRPIDLILLLCTASAGFWFLLGLGCARCFPRVGNVQTLGGLGIGGHVTAEVSAGSLPRTDAHLNLLRGKG